MRSMLAFVVAVTCSAAVTKSQAANLIADGGFETPATPVGSYTLYDTGQSISKWSVVGAQGSVATVNALFSQNGYYFPAKSGRAWLDLTGNSNTATGVAQSFKTVPGTAYTVTFWVGNVVDPGGIFGTASTVDVYDGSTLLIAATSSKGKGGNTQAWQKFATSFTATAATTTLSFINGDPSNDTDCGLDLVSVAPQKGAGR